MEAYKRYIEAKLKRIELGDDTTEIIKEMQFLYLEALEEHIKWEQGKGGKSLPEEMAFELKGHFEDIVKQHHNPYLEPTGGQGEQGWAPKEKWCIEDAVRYKFYVEEGKIKDPQSTERIMELYDVARTTVQTWNTDEHFGHVKIYDGEKFPAQVVEKLIRFSGEFYKRNFARAVSKKTKKGTPK